MCYPNGQMVRGDGVEPPIILLLPHYGNKALFVLGIVPFRPAAFPHYHRFTVHLVSSVYLLIGLLYVLFL